MKPVSTDFTVRVGKTGRLTPAIAGRLHHIGIGDAYAGWREAMFIEGVDAKAKSLNNRRRKTLGYLNPSEKLA